MRFGNSFFFISLTKYHSDYSSTEYNWALNQRNYNGQTNWEGMPS